jgi:prepilin-type N-terminal cleavage/methylation domain-containing protein
LKNTTLEFGMSPALGIAVNRRNYMTQSRSGFTILEIMTVMMIMGIVLAFGIPKFNSLRNSGRVGAAKVQASTSLTTARAAAIQNGRPSRWSVSGNTITIQAQNAAGNYVNVGQPMDYFTQYSVSLSASPSTINFDSRGLANGLNSTAKLYVRGTTTDSICVTVLGVVLRNGCL